MVLALVALLETLIRTRIGTLIRTLIFLNTEYSDYTDVRLRLSGFAWDIN